MSVTGDPVRDNQNRRAERELTRIVRSAFTIYSSRGRIARKRKKRMYLVERANYRALIVDVAHALAARA